MSYGEIPKVITRDGTIIQGSEWQPVDTYKKIEARISGGSNNAVIVDLKNNNGQFPSVKMEPGSAWFHGTVANDPEIKVVK